MQQPLFRAALHVATNYTNAMSEVPQEARFERSRIVRRWAACASITLKFIHAWHLLTEDDDHHPWHEAVREAQQLGLDQEEA